MMGLGFDHPWLLAALAVLPVLWWLLRVMPPAAREQPFPAIALLLGLSAPQTTPARTPWWLLLLRLAASGLAIIGMAGPTRHAPRPSHAPGAVLVIVDNDWAAAADWSDRMRAAEDVADQLAGPTTAVQVLTTAPEPDGGAIAPGPRTSVAELPARLAVLRPLPWRPDRAAAAAALQAVPAATRIVYLADGVQAEPAADAAFAAALRRFGSVTELRAEAPPRLLRGAAAGADRLQVSGETVPGQAGTATLRAVDPAGETLAEGSLAFAASGAAAATLVLPPSLIDRVAALRLDGGAAAGGVLLLDEGSRRHPVGLLDYGSAQDAPLLGALFYVRRALADSADLRSGDAAQLLAGSPAVIVMADRVSGDSAAAAALAAWVRKGGWLVRFAGPDLAAAAAPDTLLPVALMAGGRSLDGAMSWSRPAAIAAFPPASPFAGLQVPDDVRVARQVLAQPGDAPDRAGRQDWATLTDGTPLVTAAPLGAGTLVLFHVTANADWSNLPLSGLFPRMLRRLVALSAGQRPVAGGAALAPRRALDGFGQFTTPGAAARPLSGDAMAGTIASPLHPPGLYGPDSALRAFNLGAALPPLAASAPIAGAARLDLHAAPAPRADGPALLAAALLLLALDLVVTLNLRGLLGAAAAPMLVLMLMLAPPAARAQIALPQSALPQSGLPQSALPQSGLPSLATHLAAIETGDPQADGIARAGLQGLSDYVNARTSAVLATPVAVDPARDDLSFYPLLYWPVLADTPVPDGATLARLDDYMANGGIILFDTRDAGTADSAADQAMARLGAALAVPPLAPLTSAHVLSHSFYLLRDWPGLRDGGTVWVAANDDRGNDGVSPVIIGANDWAAAWAVDADGANPYEATPGGERQRLLAYRFGVNLVMYALTGNYKADQVHVPELLRRMGGDADGGATPDP